MFKICYLNLKIKFLNLYKKTFVNCIASGLSSGVELKQTFMSSFKMSGISFNKLFEMCFN